MTIMVKSLDESGADEQHDHVGHFFEMLFMASNQISVAQAKAEFAALVSRAEAGEEIIVTRNGKPVARIMPLIDQPFNFGDLIGLRVDDDLSLPDTIIDEFMENGF
jgi:prevent-host-death family protein